MRVVVVGASGNVGTALLRRFAQDSTVTSVVGVARRAPRVRPPAPYDVATWVACDIGADAPDEQVTAALAGVFAGADAVVHLAWAIQPSHDRARLRATNVVGTQRVMEGAERARVPHLVVASSVGAYSPSPGDVPRDETWPTDGVPSSSYSVDKAAVEALLDRAEARGDLVIARLRPALVFQHDAGQEIARYFLGPLVPQRVLDGRVPVLPWPRGLRLQAVDADDLADAYREAVVRQVRGAFNLAGPGIVRGPDVAALVSGARLRDVPVGLARAAVSVGWRARAVPVGPGWLDMAMSAPVLDTARAERELDWRPRRSGVQALHEVLTGIAAGAGTVSPPLRPRGR
ncbi:NAD-dependent epimerase/dehydratase family protein [Cellulomonas dongxiuzhuiae]|uniref:NAD-dependent epimerase/dehydratase family protein n=1 Tax=Cellulomonas dongxiuzhuiae TaxID=2819979 RepID=UPI001AAF5929|nr:NAD-dependent epimerase/dehydratase family protein [Cellulomonas dongxiuzhuiae]MBO3088674.1 NAD-dependent epimerase/dehydratase family protein [Cellulomonas dongxiuzhuiae]